METENYWLNKFLYLISCMRCRQIHSFRLPLSWITASVTAGFVENLMRCHGVIEMHVKPYKNRWSSVNFVLYCSRNFFVTWWEPWTVDDSITTGLLAIGQFHKWFLAICNILNNINNSFERKLYFIMYFLWFSATG